MTPWQRKQICPTCWAIRTHVDVKDVLSRLAPVIFRGNLYQQRTSCDISPAKSQSAQLFCRQPLEAPPVRSTVLDNIMDKSERSMSPDELEDRKQRKVNWQAFSDEAVTAWKAMFSRYKRQHTERDTGGGRLPPFMIDAIMVRHCPKSYGLDWRHTLVTRCYHLQTELPRHGRPCD